MRDPAGETVTRRALMAWLLLPPALFVAVAVTPWNAMLGAPAQGAPVSAALAADKGKLRILLNGVEVGTEQFELAPADSAWIERSETVLRVPGSGETRATGQLRLTGDGTPVHYEWTAQSSTKTSGTVDFQDGTAKTSINLGGKEPLLQDFMFLSPRVAILDNNLYGQYALLAGLYDWNVAGAQTFPVLIPQDATPGMITIELLGPSTIGGNQVTGLRVRSADLEIHAYFDARRRLMRLEVPEVKVVVVRE
jgi:hypothetical protein